MMVYAVVYDLLWDTPLVDVIYEAIAAQLPPPPCDVREIGAGTGLITRRLLDDGYTVLARWFDACGGVPPKPRSSASGWRVAAMPRPAH